MAEDQALGELRPCPAALLIKVKDGGEGGPVLIRHERAEVVGEPLRQHRQHHVGQIDAGAALERLAVKGSAGPDVVADISDGDKEPIPLLRLLHANRVVEVLGRGPVNGDMAEMAEVAAALVQFSQRHERGDLCLHFRREDAGQVKLLHRHAQLHRYAVRQPQHFDHPAQRLPLRGAVVKHLH